MRINNIYCMTEVTPLITIYIYIYIYIYWECFETPGRGINLGIKRRV